VPVSSRTTFSLPLQILLWTIANSAAGAAVGLAVGAFREGGIEAPIVLIGVLFGNVVGLTVQISTLVLFPRLRLLPPLARFAILGLVLAAGAVGGTAIVLYLFPLFILRDVGQVVALGAINVVVAVIVGSVVYAYDGLRFRLAESLREVEEVRLVEARLKEQAARAELAALQARINPHFFFNTLNTISSLLEEDPEAAEDVVQKLADLFRYTLKASDAGSVSLDDELRFIEGYLSIEQARFGTRLRVVWEVEPDVRSVAIPGLMLQPLVENAVGHGLARVPEGGTLRIAASRRRDRLEITVEDDGAGPGPDPRALFAEGHGLDNVHQRLRTRYSERASLRIEPRAGGRGTAVRLVLPLEDADKPAIPAVDREEVRR
jgi:two-component system sensor histidine kinase AlgZ